MVKRSIKRKLSQEKLFFLEPIKENRTSFKEYMKHWKDMPEFIVENLIPYRTLPVHFATKEDMNAFSKLVGQPITKVSRCLWFPAAEIGRISDKRYVDEGKKKKRKKR
jgi:hypothetical protein